MRDDGGDADIEQELGQSDREAAGGFAALGETSAAAEHVPPRAPPWRARAEGAAPRDQAGRGR
ncbi:MAG TPA: hypothetical protein VMB72_13030 [Acidimicrobiales bacterium]|nr:hypothetical protein [Acidimicrobiales bacterium]